ncbi:MAG: thiolase family protein [Thermodesulfobacteriota bacterium]
MSQVMIIGAGCHPCGRFPGKHYLQIGREAVEMALKDAGLAFKDIEAAYCSRVFLPQCTGLKVLTQFGRTGIPIVDVEAACASSGAALRQAHQAIVSGRHDLVLVFGLEKMPTGFLPPPNYTEWQIRLGLGQNPMYWALAARRHMHDYGTTIEQIGAISVKNHKYGALNPLAMYRQEMTLAQVLNSKPVCDPITLYMICAPNEGAAAVVLCNEKTAKRFTTRPVTLAAIAHKIGRYPMLNVAAYHHGPVDDYACATTDAANEAFNQAGLGPRDVDVAEVQDTDAFCELEAYEHLGFCPTGEGGRLVEERATEIGGRIPVNVSGGLISNGEPVGASGLRQVYEMILQLRGQAGARQVGEAKVALTHVYGADGHSSVAILKG